MAAVKITREICKFIEGSQDAKGEWVNYRFGLNFALLFALQKAFYYKMEIMQTGYCINPTRRPKI